MFRDESINALQFTNKFKELKEKLDARVEIRLDSEYHHQLKAYIVSLYAQSCDNEAFNDKALEDIRDVQMSHLNRLQKLKNGTSYKKDKHKAQSRQEDWG